MNAYFLPGVTGLMTGLLLHWAGFDREANLRLALGLRRSYALRTGLTAVGWAMAMTALLMWLAVIDVDTIAVLPLSLGALLGGALLGICAGLCGFTPLSAFAGAGTPDALSALSVLAGGFAGGLLLPALDVPFSALREAAPYAAATLFEVTLDEPFLLSGGFLAQGCAGLLGVVMALCIPSPRVVIIDVPQPSADADSDADADSNPDPDPESTAVDTFVSLQEGEEPLVIDTAQEEGEEPLVIDTALEEGESFNSLEEGNSPEEDKPLEEGNSLEEG